MSTYDLEVWTIAPDGEMIASAGTGGRVKGIKKVVQRYFIALLQDLNPDKPSCGRRQPYGSGFLHTMRAGEMRTEMDVLSSFNLAKVQVRMALQDEETDDDPDDERFTNSSLNKIEITPGIMKLHIRITTRTDSIDVIFPISTE